TFMGGVFFNNLLFYFTGNRHEKLLESCTAISLRPKVRPAPPPRTTADTNALHYHLHAEAPNLARCIRHAEVTYGMRIVALFSNPRCSSRYQLRFSCIRCRCLSWVRR